MAQTGEQGYLGNPRPTIVAITPPPPTPLQGQEAKSTHAENPGLSPRAPLPPNNSITLEASGLLSWLG